MNINQLPDDGLILILKKIPIYELIYLREVCPLWKSIIGQILDSKRNLKLFGSVSHFGDYCKDLLHYNLQNNSLYKLNADEVNEPILAEEIQCGYSQLELFRNLAHVTVYDIKFFEEKLHFAELTSLSVNTSIFKNADYAYEKINQISSLKCLHLFRVKTSLQNLNILGQLEEFSVCGNLIDRFLGSLGRFLPCNNSNNSIAVLKQLNPNLKKLTIKFLSIKLSELEDLIQENPHLTKLTHLAIDSVLDDKLAGNEKILEHKKLFFFVCTNFQHLKWLEIKPEPALTHDEVTFNLNQLKHLQELRLLGFRNMHGNLLSQKVKTVQKLYIKAAYSFPRANYKEIFPNIAQFTLSGVSSVLEEGQKYLKNHPLGDTEVVYEKIFGDFQDYMGRLRETHEEYMELQNEIYERQEEIEIENYYNTTDNIYVRAWRDYGVIIPME